MFRISPRANLLAFLATRGCGIGGGGREGGGWWWGGGVLGGLGVVEDWGLLRTGGRGLGVVEVRGWGTGGC